jgi:hypothetical protein
MPRKRGRKPTSSPRAVRASVSLRPEIYRTLEALAKQKNVSTAWVLRDAAERYLADQWPLFGSPNTPESPKRNG